MAIDSDNSSSTSSSTVSNIHNILPVAVYQRESMLDNTASGNESINQEGLGVGDGGGGGGEMQGIPLLEAVLFAIFTSVCICVTVIGNILVIMSVFTYRPLRNVPNFFIVSLAVADLAVALLVMPFNVANFCVGYWVFGKIFCNMWLTFDILTCTASILNLCAIAIDRYYAIHDPINYSRKRTLKRVMVTIALVWGLSAVISIPPLIGWNNSSGTGLFDEKTGICELTDEKGYVIYSASGSFYIPLIIMSFVYINIFRATRRRLRQRANAAAAARTMPLTAKGASTENHATGCDEGDESSSEETPEHSPRATSFNTNSSVVSLQGVSLTGKGQGKGHPLGGGGDGGVLCPPPSSPGLHFKRTHNGTSDKKHQHKEKSPPSQVHKFLEEKQRISLSRERRAARTMSIIMATFVACWLPFFLMYVIFPFCKSCAKTDPRIINFIVWLGYINSALNPIIYTVFNIDFRRAFTRLLNGKWRGNR